MSNWSGEGGNWGRAYELMEERKRRNLTAMVSVKEVNDIFDAHKRREIEARRQREAEMGYLDRQLNPFRIGDSVKLKDSPYQGRITTLEAGSGVTFKSTLGPHISVTDDTLLELVTAPVETGDIYVDKNDFEWIIREYASRRHEGEPDVVYKVAQLIDARPRNGFYPRAAVDINKPANFQRWVQEYRPTLFRRRGQ